MRKHFGMSDLKDYSMIRDDVENKIAKYIGTRYAVVCSSGRNALRFSLLALGISNLNEVIIPDFACQILPITVFSTTASPIFCDINRETCALSPSRLLDVLTPNTKAVVFIHPYGFGDCGVAVYGYVILYASRVYLPVVPEN